MKKKEIKKEGEGGEGTDHGTLSMTFSHILAPRPGLLAKQA